MSTWIMIHTHTHTHLCKLLHSVLGFLSPALTVNTHSGEGFRLHPGSRTHSKSFSNSAPNLSPTQFTKKKDGAEGPGPFDYLRLRERPLSLQLATVSVYTCSEGSGEMN